MLLLSLLSIVIAKLSLVVVTNTDDTPFIILPARAHEVHGTAGAGGGCKPDSAALGSPRPPRTPRPGRV